MKDIYIIGAGTYGEVMLELAKDCGYNVKGFYDDNRSDQDIMGVKILGRFSDCKSTDIENNNFIVAIGNNKVRHDIMTRIINDGGNVPSLIHPTAKISESAVVGKGVYIQMGAVIWTKVSIGDFTIISPNTVIAHHTKIGHSCLISTLCTVGASITVGDYTMMGIGSIAITGIKKIGNNVMFGAGTTAIKDVEDNVLIVGSPARVIKKRDPII